MRFIGGKPESLRSGPYGQAVPSRGGATDVARTRENVERRIESLVGEQSRLRAVLSRLEHDTDTEAACDEATRLLDAKRAIDDRMERAISMSQQVAESVSELSRRVDGLSSIEERLAVAIPTLLRQVLAEVTLKTTPVEASGCPEAAPAEPEARPGPAKATPKSGGQQDFLGGPDRFLENDRKRLPTVFGKTHPRFREAAVKAIAYVQVGGTPLKPKAIAEYLRGPGEIPEFQVDTKNLGNRFILMGFGRVRLKRNVNDIYFWPVGSKLSAKFEQA